LGSARDVSLARARELAAQCRAKLAEGVKPVSPKRAAKPEGGVPFGDVADDVIESMKKSWKNKKHVAQWEMTLKVYAAPLRDLDVDKITTEDVLSVLKPLWETKTETATRLRSRIGRVLNAAKARGLRSGENPARWRGHLDTLLPKRSKVQKVRNHPALPYLQIPEFMAELRQQQGVAARCLEFTILTAARSGESHLLPWEGEIDNNIWTVPPERMKGEREHKDPLTPAALTLVEDMRKIRCSRYVFPGDKEDRPLSDMSLTAVIRRMSDAREKQGLPRWVDPKQGNADVVPHGFRSTFKDWATDWAPSPAEIVKAAKRGELVEAFPRDLIEVALAHKVDSKVEEAYRRTDMIEKRRRLTERWAAYCNGPVGGAKVLRPEFKGEQISRRKRV
jgi:integrase